MEMHSPMCKLALLVLLVVFQIQSFLLIEGQQDYVNNYQLDCYDEATKNITKGFVCNGVEQSCQSYLTFRSEPPYNSALYIAYLLGAEPSLITSINNLTSDIATIPTKTQVIVPVNCSCSSHYYQHNSSYMIHNDMENYFTIANDTYQGLSTCRAMIAANPIDSRNLSVRDNLTAPLRCACPTGKQVASGAKYLLSYMVTWGDDISAIAELFQVDKQSVHDANKLSEDDLIFPFTPILVPLATEPTKIDRPMPSPPAPFPKTPLNLPAESNSSKKWVFVGVGIGAGLLLLLALSTSLFCFYGRRSKKHKSKLAVSSSGPKMVSESTDYSPVLPGKTNSFLDSVSSQGYRSAVDSLTLYKFKHLQNATGDFKDENRIRGSVYKGSFNGDYAAIKVVKGDDSSEINLLKKINHGNIIRLSGFCVHQANTYLVYEFADNGSLSDSLQSEKYQTSDTLEWKQRVQIACDVANALSYLHVYTNPPYIHKNLKSSNILLDANFRAKITNFGLARSVNNYDQRAVQLTRHVVGTHGYLAPEYIENGIITPKLDVFAFGVVVLEIISGREALTDDKNSGVELLYKSISKVLEGENVRDKLRGFIDPCLRNEYPLDLAFSMAQLAKQCVAYDLNARPSMPEVFITLSKILSSSLDWDPSDELDRSK